MKAVDTYPSPGPLIDSHVHVIPEKRLRGLMRWIIRAYPDHPVPEDVKAQDILKDLVAEKATHFFNLVYPLKVEETDPLNDFNARFCRATPGSVPFASMHQDTRDKAGVAEQAFQSHPFVGFKFHPFVQRFDPWDPRMDPLYGFLEEAGRPVLFHTGFEAFYGKPMPTSGLESLLKRYPRLPMVFVHMAFPELAWAFRMMDQYPDLYLDATNVLACFRPEYGPLLSQVPEGSRLREVLVEGLDQHRGRVMFGSDHPAGIGSLHRIYRDLEELPVDDETRRSIRAGAAASFVDRFLPGFDWKRSLRDYEPG